MTSTLQAQRAKSLDEYFTNLEQDAQKLAHSLDALQNYMNEINKPDFFLTTEFDGLTPQWHYYFENNPKVTKFLYFTNVCPQKKKKAERTIRNITLTRNDHKQSNNGLYLDSRDLHNKERPNFIGHRYLSIIYKEVSKRNQESALNDFDFHIRKVQYLLNQYLFLKLNELYEDINLHDKNKYKLFMKKNHKNVYHYHEEDKYQSPLIQYYLDSLSAFSIMHYTYQFKIKYKSKSDLYNKQNDFIAILDEYENKGFCQKFTKNIHRDNKLIIYTSLKSTGKYRAKIIYDPQENEGEWITPMSTIEALNDLKEITMAINNSFKNFEKNIQYYYKLATDNIVEKYTELHHQNKFGNEF